MIRIKSKTVKKTKAYIEYEFSVGDETKTKTYSMSAKVFWEMSEQDLFNRIRGQVLKERIKLRVPRPQAISENELIIGIEDPEEETETED